MNTEKLFMSWVKLSRNYDFKEKSDSNKVLFNEFYKTIETYNREELKSFVFFLSGVFSSTLKDNPTWFLEKEK